MSRDSPLFVIVAAEPSGDLLAGHLIPALRAYYPSARFIGITGPHMKNAGCESLYSVDELSVMLLTDIIGHLWRILKMRRHLVEYCLREKPAAFIGVDAPEFNLAIETQLRKAGIKTIHYNSPKIWAWRAKRIHKIAKSCSLMLTQFPFEKELYDAANIPAKYVGHPLADQIPLHHDKQAARATCGIKDGLPVLAILPGSRAQELKQLLQIYLLTAEQLHQEIPGGIQCVIPLINQKRRQQYEEIRSKLTLTVPIHLLEGQAQIAMIASDAILVTAGTATLEAMLINRPMAVAYRTNRFSFSILQALALNDYISLPNVISRQALVPEYIQDEVQVGSLVAVLKPYLLNPNAPFKHHARFAEMHLELRKNAAVKTAEAIYEIL